MPVQIRAQIVRPAIAPQRNQVHPAQFLFDLVVRHRCPFECLNRGGSRLPVANRSRRIGMRQRIGVAPDIARSRGSEPRAAGALRCCSSGGFDHSNVFEIPNKSNKSANILTCFLLSPNKNEVIGTTERSWSTSPSPWRYRAEDGRMQASGRHSLAAYDAVSEPLRGRELARERRPALPNQRRQRIPRAHGPKPLPGRYATVTRTAGRECGATQRYRIGERDERPRRLRGVAPRWRCAAGPARPAHRDATSSGSCNYG